jgi:hypothetical protein
VARHYDIMPGRGGGWEVRTARRLVRKRPSLSEAVVDARRYASKAGGGEVRVRASRDGDVTSRETIKGERMATNYEVLPNPDGGWDVRKDGGKRASSRHGTQREAARAAKDYARNAGGGEVRVHDRAGRVRSSDTIAKEDPFPPRG